MIINSYQIGNALNVIRTLGLPGSDELAEAWSNSLRLDSWLAAEQQHNQYVRSWLDAETAWKRMQWALAHQIEYRAAKAGWLKMREKSPNLDGVPTFENLGAGLQDRYARFAEGVIADLGIYDPEAWAYVDPNDAGYLAHWSRKRRTYGTERKDRR